MDNKRENQSGLRRPARRLAAMAPKAYHASMSVLGALARFASPFSNKLREVSGKYQTPATPFAIWVHACSAGEMMVARRFIGCWREKTGQDRIFLSAWTRDGYRIAKSQTQPNEMVGWFPVDSRAAMRRAYDVLKPRAVVLCETELWPNHLAEAEKRGIPAFVINGRMSETDQAKYLRLGSFATKFFAIPDTVFAQSQDDARRFAALGARRTVVTGNMKFDEFGGQKDNTREAEASSESRYVLAASTHRGEEASVLRAFMHCRTSRRNLKLIIAPRQVKRSAAVAHLARQHGLQTRLWSRNRSINDAECIVVDRVGLLPSLYAHARFAFVGKSLHAHGGQNFLEAVETGCPVVLGPHTENFDNMLAPFKATNAVWQIASPDELAGAFETLLDDNLKRDEMVAMAHRIMEEQSGATKTTVREILSRL